jgi:hypothetical protein
VQLVSDGSPPPPLKGGKGGNKAYRLTVLEDAIPRFMEVWAYHSRPLACNMHVVQPACCVVCKHLACMHAAKHSIKSCFTIQTNVHLGSRWQTSSHPPAP